MALAKYPTLRIKMTENKQIAIPPKKEILRLLTIGSFFFSCIYKNIISTRVCICKTKITKKAQFCCALFDDINYRHDIGFSPVFTLDKSSASFHCVRVNLFDIKLF